MYVLHLQLITQMLEFMLKPETGFNSVQISKVAMQLAEVDPQLGSEPEACACSG